MGQESSAPVSIKLCVGEQNLLAEEERLAEADPEIAYVNRALESVKSALKDARGRNFESAIKSISEVGKEAVDKTRSDWLAHFINISHILQYTVDCYEYGGETSVPPDEKKGRLDLIFLLLSQGASVKTVHPENQVSHTGTDTGDITLGGEMLLEELGGLIEVLVKENPWVGEYSWAGEDPMVLKDEYIDHYKKDDGFIADVIKVGYLVGSKGLVRKIGVKFTEEEREFQLSDFMVSREEVNVITTKEWCRNSSPTFKKWLDVMGVRFSKKTMDDEEGYGIIDDDIDVDDDGMFKVTWNPKEIESKAILTELSKRLEKEIGITKTGLVILDLIQDSEKLERLKMYGYHSYMLSTQPPLLGYDKDILAKMAEFHFGLSSDF